MPVLLGPFDPLQLVFNLMNTLLRRGVITQDEARAVIHDSLNPSLTEEQKTEIIDSMLRRG